MKLITAVIKPFKLDGAEAVGVFYVVDGSGQPVRDLAVRGRIAAEVLQALTG